MVHLGFFLPLYLVRKAYGNVFVATCSHAGCCHTFLMKKWAKNDEVCGEKRGQATEERTDETKRVVRARDFSVFGVGKDIQVPKRPMGGGEEDLGTSVPPQRYGSI